MNEQEARELLHAYEVVIRDLKRQEDTEDLTYEMTQMETNTREAVVQDLSENVLDQLDEDGAVAISSLLLLDVIDALEKLNSADELIHTLRQLQP